MSPYMKKKVSKCNREGAVRNKKKPPILASYYNQGAISLLLLIKSINIISLKLKWQVRWIDPLRLFAVESAITYPDQGGAPESLPNGGRTSLLI